MDASTADPTDLVVRGSRRDGDAVIDDVAFSAEDGAEVEAYVVRPAGDAPAASLAGVLAWHWLDTEAPDGNRTEFLGEAQALAERGVVSLLPQGRFPWSIDPTGAAADAAEVRREVARLRRGLDLLAARPEVDGGRLAAMGHDFGAMFAVLAAADDPRIQGLALIAPTPRWGDWFLPFWPIAEDRIAYLAAMRELDPVEAIGRVAPRPTLLQLAERDFFIPVMAGFELRRAGGGAEVVDLRTYDAAHDVRVDAAASDRAEFLGRVLGLR